MCGQAITANHELFDAGTMGGSKTCNLVDSPFSNIDKKSLYLRVILNSICNAKCYFCHKEGKKVIKNLPIDILMSAVSDSASLGFKKVKYTGGEPLLRKDLALITSMIKTIDPEIEISMTTNGILLKEKIDSLLKAGLDRMNISLHSLNRENYKKIVGIETKVFLASSFEGRRLCILNPNPFSAAYLAIDGIS